MYDMLFIESFSSSLPCRERFMSSPQQQRLNRLSSSIVHSWCSAACLFHLTSNICTQGYHFSGVPGNLEMSGNFAKVREKSGNLCSEGYLIVTPWQYAGNKTDELS